MNFKPDISLALNLAPKAEPKERANFATAARLLSCLVSESLVHAIYRPLHRTNLNVAGFATIFKGGVSLENSAFEADNILAVVPLHHAPIFKHDVDYRHGHQIGLLNPLDMMFAVYETKNIQNGIDDRYPIDVCSFLLDLKGSDSHRHTRPMLFLLFWNLLQKLHPRWEPTKYTNLSTCYPFGRRSLRV
jgi:hypothetical protein